MTEPLEAHLQRQIEHSDRFFWHRLRWRAVRSYLPEHEPFVLVDVGAGAGLLGTYLTNDRPEATYAFVEPIESLREFLCEIHGPAADASGWDDFHQARFVTLLDVLEHQENDAEFMETLVAKMTPGSTLLVTVPAQQRLWSPWDAALGHFRRYDKATLLRTVNALPLAVDELSFLFPEMVPLAMLRARKRGDSEVVAADAEAEFPDLPGPVNDVLYGLGTASNSLRRRSPTGTSLFLAARVIE